jgi:PAS domain S-box-containing protein
MEIQNLNVLIVEDSADDAHLILRELQKAGYNVEAERVETRATMQEALARQRWDVILSDYSMPHFSAMAALETLKASGQDIPFIVVSGTIGEEAAVVMLKAGAHDFLVKDKLARLMPAIEREMRDAEVRRSRREAESRYQLLVERLPVIVYVSPANHVDDTTYVSPQIQTILGYSPEEWLEDPHFWQTRLHPTDREGVLYAVEESGRTGAPASMEYRMFRRDGSIVWFHDQSVLVRDDAGQPLYWQGIKIDITQRKEAEVQASQSEERFSKAFRASPIAISITRISDGLFTDVNNSFLGLLGYSREEVVGRTELDLSVYPNVEERTKLIEKLQTQGDLRNYEMTIQTKSGEVIHVLLSTELIELKGEAHALATILDITERKRSEAEILRLNAELERRVDERTRELERALRAKDEFLASMSHELRTPLNAILGLSESLAEHAAGPLNEKQTRYIRTISESGHHLLSLINDILDLARIEASQIVLNITEVDVKQVCQASLRMINELALKKQQELTLEVDDAIGSIWVDERRLKQILVNLLSNAVKFTPAGGRLGLQVTGDRQEKRVMLSVWDNGIGIATDDLGRLFQPFVQLDSSLTREAPGTGLGLALVAQMARLHGGSVSVESQPDQGSRFTVTLPWEPALATDPELRMRSTGKFRAIRPEAKDRPILLLIEDTREATVMLTDYLQLAGYQVLSARDAHTGMDLAKRIRPDLILMDVHLPGMDGLEATRRLRADPDFRTLPIIALTALAMPGDRERCLAAGATDYVTKPVSLKKLAALIDEYLLS